MVKIEASYEGSLATMITHLQSGARIRTSAPLDNGGDGMNFSPTDLLAASLLSCMLTTMAIRAEKLGIPFVSPSGTVEKHMVADPLRRVGKLVVSIKMPAHLSAENFKILEEAGRMCPVAKSIAEHLDAQITFLT
jgi:putative redox protein